MQKMLERLEKASRTKIQVWQKYRTQKNECRIFLRSIFLPSLGPYRRGVGNVGLFSDRSSRRSGTLNLTNRTLILKARWLGAVLAVTMLCEVAAFILPWRESRA